MHNTRHLVFAQPLSSAAQAYPSKLIRIVVPLPPGGSIDLTARVVSERSHASLGRPAVVENRPGASGDIATVLVANPEALYGFSKAA